MEDNLRVINGEEPRKRRGNPHLKGRPKQIPVKCLIPQCLGFFGAEGEPGGRGLCKDCHTKASSLIKRGLTTWEELEGLHLAQPKYGSIVEKALVEARQTRASHQQENDKTGSCVQTLSPAPEM